MKFGVYIGPFYPGEMGGAQALDLALGMARSAHEGGFDGIFAAHHYALGPSHMLFHPFVILARLVAECPGSYLGTAVFLLPLTHPIEVAEATSLLDVMCGGKLLFGVGQGYRELEFRSFGVPRAERGARLGEAVRAVRTLWADEPASFNGRFYQFADVSIRPKPLQRPGPPVWVGADTVETVARTPDIGDGWIASGRHTRVRDEVLAVEAFDSLIEAQTVINDWKDIYNHKRPHSSLGWRTPAAYTASLTTDPKETAARLS
jgi:alkanesulfonate monooxygenase SsuD/methylene tetrahydromethanopterin reductase-like flavin-dependent oxidoreductase (luciferase family)